jgi:hypothetical protein
VVKEEEEEEDADAPPSSSGLLEVPLGWEVIVDSDCPIG